MPQFFPEADSGRRKPRAVPSRTRERWHIAEANQSDPSTLETRRRFLAVEPLAQVLGRRVCSCGRVVRLRTRLMRLPFRTCRPNASWRAAGKKTPGIGSVSPGGTRGKGGGSGDRSTGILETTLLYGEKPVSRDPLLISWPGLCEPIIDLALPLKPATEAAGGLS